MENINPTLLLLIEVRRHIEAGESVKSGLQSYLQSNKCEFSQAIHSWYYGLQNGGPIRNQRILSTSSRLAVLHLLERGLRGEPILKSLEQLESEVRQSCLAELEHFVATLPFKVMIPLLLIVFPSIMYLILAPIVGTLLSSQ